MDWFSAQTYCRNNYTDLAIVRNDAENQRVKSFETNGLWPWIGLHRDLTFNWSDWSSARFHGDWNNDAKPIRSLKFICGATSTQNSGKWTFKSCETRLPFVCYGPPGEFFYRPMVIRKYAIGLDLIRSFYFIFTNHQYGGRW